MHPPPPRQMPCTQAPAHNLSPYLSQEPTPQPGLPVSITSAPKPSLCSLCRSQMHTNSRLCLCCLFWSQKSLVLSYEHKLPWKFNTHTFVRSLVNIRHIYIYLFYCKEIHFCIVDLKPILPGEEQLPLLRQLSSIL